MKLSSLIAPLVAAKAPHEQLMAVILAFEEQDEAAKEASLEKGRERWRRWDAKRKANVSKREQTFANVSRQLASAEDRTSNTVIEPQEKKDNARSNDLADFRSELSSLDAPRLDALIKHRKAKRAQMTGHAARLFVKDAVAAGLTLSQAVDTCISRNWITVKAEWLAKPAARGSPQEPSAAEIFKHMAQKAREKNGQDSAGFGASGDNLFQLPLPERRERG